MTLDPPATPTTESPPTATRTMPVVTYKYPQQGLPPIAFSDLDMGPLPDGPWRLTIERADVERWARLFDDDPAEALAAGIAPPDILYYPGMNLPAPKRDYGGPMSRYWAEYRGPLPIGEPIELHGAITEKFLRRGRGGMTFELVARVGGAVVQRHWRRFALRLAPGEADGWEERGSDPRPPEPAADAERFGPRLMECTQARYDDFEGPGELTGHTSLEAAHQGGHPTTTAQGALSFGLLTRLMRDRFGDRFTQGGTIDVRLVRTVYEGELLQAHGVLLEEAEGRVQCRIWAENRAGDPVTTGTASASVPLDR